MQKTDYYTLSAAIAAAKRISSQRKKIVYVVRENDPYYGDYHVCSEIDLDTYYLGAEIVYCTAN